MKISITMAKKPKLKRPIMICAWPGMGDVAFRLAVYLKDKLKMEEFASLQAADLFPPTGVWVDNSVIQLPVPGEGKFYYYKNKPGLSDLVVFISNAQPLLELCGEYIWRILSLGKELRIKRIFTFAAMPAPIDHTAEPGVLFSSTDKKINDELESAKLGLRALKSGQVSGLNGLMLGFAKEAGFEGVCFLAEIPLFALQMENPKASLAILKKLSSLLTITVDLSGLVDQAKFMEQEIEKIIEFINNPEQQPPPPIGEDEIDKIKKSLNLYTKLPQSAREKIEKLFGEVKNNVSKAGELKKELDNWSVYKEYEDRFLDLFKKPKAESQNN